MAYKVVYNTCNGGFALSRAAVELARKLSGNLRWGGVLLPGDTLSDGSTEPDHGYEGYFLDRTVLRHDPILVQVVETLGVAANAGYSDICITEVKGLYRIEQHGVGTESVLEPADLVWVDPSCKEEIR